MWCCRSSRRSPASALTIPACSVIRWRQIAFEKGGHHQARRACRHRAAAGGCCRCCAHQPPSAEAPGGVGDAGLRRQLTTICASAITACRIMFRQARNLRWDWPDCTSWRMPWSRSLRCTRADALPGGYAADDPAGAGGCALGRPFAGHRAGPDQPTLLVDSAHNAYSAEMLGRALRDNYDYEQLLFVFGAPADKAIPQMMERLFPLAEGVFLAAADHPRAAEPRGAGGAGA